MKQHFLSLPQGVRLLFVFRSILRQQYACQKGGRVCGKTLSHTSYTANRPGNAELDGATISAPGLTKGRHGRRDGGTMNASVCACVTFVAGGVRGSPKIDVDAAAIFSFVGGHDFALISVSSPSRRRSHVGSSSKSLKGEPPTCERSWILNSPFPPEISRARFANASCDPLPGDRDNGIPSHAPTCPVA